jgi:hypothetical protein
MRAVPSSLVDMRTKECLRFNGREGVFVAVSGDIEGLGGGFGKVMTSGV